VRPCRRTLQAMTGYAAAARIERASPRLIAIRGGPSPADGDEPPSESVADLVTSADDAVAAAGAPIAERWSAARERWAQLTFYLTDPNSWR